MSSYSRRYLGRPVLYKFVNNDVDLLLYRRHGRITVSIGPGEKQAIPATKMSRLRLYVNRNIGTKHRRSIFAFYFNSTGQRRNNYRSPFEKSKVHVCLMYVE